MNNLGAWELIIIVILVIVIFSGRKLPAFGRALVRGALSLWRAVTRAPEAPVSPSDSRTADEKNTEGPPSSEGSDENPPKGGA